jgi:ankyrin repeat protein
MAMNNFETFEKDLLTYLIKDSKKCIETINNNSKLIEGHLSTRDSAQVKAFVNNFNNAVLNPKVKKYKLFEKVLEHELFATVLAQFRESDVLIKAIKQYNENAIKWLLDMNINFGAQDENGMTALMHAVKNDNYLNDKFYKKLVKTIIKTNGKHIQFTDNEGNTALFHAILAKENFENIKNFMKYKDNFDCNHINNKNENILLYACRHSRLVSPDYFALLKKYVTPSVDPNITNDEGKTPAMYLAQRRKYKGLKYYIKEYNIDPNYKSKFGCTLVSEFIKSYYKFYSENIVEDSESVGLNLRPLKQNALTLMALIDLGCDLKSPVDEEGNTVTSILVKMKDELSIKYLLEKGIIDIAIDNKNIQSKKYPEIDISNPSVQKNMKSFSKWLTEVYFPSGTINTHTIGVLFGGSNVSYSYR